MKTDGPTKLALIGLRGTGKSTVGRDLAKRLNWEFLDSDSIVQDRAGKSIRQLFAENGESEFRRLETEVVQECCKRESVVIATGGGAVLNPANVAALRQNGFVVHLTASPSELWCRISKDRTTAETRPRLTTADTELDELKKLMLSRAAIYAQARHAEVSVEGRSPDEVLEAVLILMRAHGVIQPGELR
jgi:shikimate kinase